ncbi:hypothetical protein EJ04DRAFT_339454 [Polyplosphaeria fusca]|uniref:C2H2-type domain-containing protein n=1 Tax=Polyplosphaeria fusca TaxID=682080 RepID=A0A9P4QVH2_9PLEO|nr:hypothetical protein EJ04DRAFT_339454 [Polyplosphaeria fusca]
MSSMANSIRNRILDLPLGQQANAKIFAATVFQQLLDENRTDMNGQDRSNVPGELTPPIMSMNSASKRVDSRLALTEAPTCVDSPEHAAQGMGRPSPIGWKTLTSTVATSETPELLLCDITGCGARFTGEYRRGNCARHRRLSHGGNIGGTKNFPCEEAGCGKMFKRQDARLKHYRRRHPKLASAPLVPRS